MIRCVNVKRDLNCWKPIVWISFLVLPLWSSLAATTYYVNDAWSTNDVYTSASGNDANAGTNAAAPKATLNSLFTSTNLGPGDIVYVDTGSYTGGTVMATNHAGVATNRILIIGSTNRMAGGTVLRNLGGIAFSLTAAHVEFRDLILRDSAWGIFWQQHATIRPQFKRIWLINNTRGLAVGAGTGVGSSAINQCLFVSNTTAIAVGGFAGQLTKGFFVDQSVFWRNGTAIDGFFPDLDTVSNSVVVGGTVFKQAIWSGDHNVFWDIDYFLNRGGFGGAINYQTTLDDIQRATTSHLSSIVFNPEFANPDGLDFHPRSKTGRFDPASSSMVTDSVHSVLIDFGSPLSSAWTNEPVPNGNRMNVGLYGGSAEASLSRTSGWLQAVSYSDMGTLYFSNRLYWTFGGIATSATVALDYSRDNGVNWSLIASNVPLNAGSYLFNAASVTSTPIARWRIRLDGNPSVASTNRTPFAIRGHGLISYYVNDASLSGDVYASAPGNDANDGASPATPKATLGSVLTNYVLRGDHSVFIDTGIYTTQTFTIDAQDYGSESRSLIIQGSTNQASAGSVFAGVNSGTDILRFSKTTYIEFRDLTLQGGNDALELLGDVVYCFFRGVTVCNSQNGINVNSSQQNRFENCVAAHNSTGIKVSNNSAGNHWVGGVSWSNTSYAFETIGNFLSVSNSLIAGGPAFALIPSAADFNVFWNASLGGGYNNLFELQEVLGIMLNSTFSDPHFADPANGDFHPRSITGRYSPTNGLFVTDALHSPLIDFGAVGSMAWTNESAPNGSRLNVGRFGGTTFASRSRTNAWLQTLSYNDGGQLSVNVDEIRWTYGALETGMTVRIEFSFNGGASWEIMGTNIPATDQSYVVANTNFSSSRNSRWRIVLEQDPSTVATNAADFTFRNGPYRYYVNDTSTVGDVYSSGIGNNGNLGTTPDLPKASLVSVLETYDLDAGDIVYVDTGVYVSGQTITFSVLQAGTNGNPVVIQGSTNRLAGGTVFRAPAAPIVNAFAISPGVQDVALRDLTIERHAVGVQISGASRIQLERVNAVSNIQHGVSILNGHDITLRNMASVYGRQNGVDVQGISSNISLINSVVWMNQSNAVSVTGGRVLITNSALGAKGTIATIYRTPTSTNVIGNFNNLVTKDGASVGKVSSMESALNSLSAWQAVTGSEHLSMDADPQFANAEGLDFHLRSQTVQGRFDPALGWVTDTVTSPLIDAGDPAYGYEHETSPNGGRVNIGLYGNTPEASRVDVGRVMVGGLRQGGWIQGTATLHWIAANLDTSTVVDVDVSMDGGESWASIGTGLVASVEALNWDTTLTSNFVAGLWRVTVSDNPLLTSQTTNFFTLRNGPVSFYLNDSSTNQDQFTSAPGAATNWSATSSHPLNALSTVFDKFDLEPGDTIYLDAGTYPVTNTINIGLLDRGLSTSHVAVVGAVSCGDSGTPLAILAGTGLTSSQGLSLDLAGNLSLSNLVLRDMGTALQVTNSFNLNFSGLQILSARTNAVIVGNGSNVMFRGSVIEGSRHVGWDGYNNQQARLENCVFWTNAYAAIRVRNGSVTLSNSVLKASGAGGYVFVRDGAAQVRSDYNNVLIDNLANLAFVDQRVLRFLSSWQAETTNDLRSLSHEPNFVDQANGLYYLSSTVGRYDPNGCGITTDLVDSVLIDVGSPSSAFSLEPTPNGGRINLGLYGNRPEASLSTTNGRLLALTLNAGGTMRLTNTLYWFANAVVSNHLVYLDFSLDNGLTWTNIATNVSASSGSYLWDSSEFPATPSGRWRVTSQTDPSIASTSGIPFTLNNGSLTYYVNDTATNGDVYCSVPGDNVNDGLSSASPVADIREIFSRYVPGPGDRILWDTGDYSMEETVELSELFSGILTNPVIIAGSTNGVAGGTRINAGRSGPVFLLNEAAFLTFRDLSITNALQGFVLRHASNVRLERVSIQSADQIVESGVVGAYGVGLESSTNILLDQVVIRGVTNASDSAAIRLAFAPNSTIRSSIDLSRSVLWSNRYGVWARSPSHVSISNSILQAYGREDILVDLAFDSTLSCNYNGYWIPEGATLIRQYEEFDTSPAARSPVYFDRLARWQAFSGMDSNSLAHDPRLVDPGGGDFSLKSRDGRYTPSGLVTDAVTSALIDAGDPSAPFDLEPEPNGGRMNIGPDGNAASASLSTTNLDLIILSFNDGGMVSGTNVQLRWEPRGPLSPSDEVTVRYSDSGGFSWNTIAANVPMTQNVYAWDSTSITSAHQLIWGLATEQAPSFSVRSDRPYAIRNANLAFYVNDGSTSGDVYTTSAGASTNDGLSPESPMLSVQDVLDGYDLEPGDRLYVDTGVYELTEPVVWGQLDGGNSTAPVTLTGSTNSSAGGTVFVGNGIAVEASRGLRVEHVTITKTNGTLGFGININASSNVVLQQVTAVEARNGFSISNSVNVQMNRCVSRNATSRGLNLQTVRNIHFENGILWNSGQFGISSLANLTVSNSILTAIGSGKALYGGSASLLSSVSLDHNAYYVESGALIGSLSFSGESLNRLYESLYAWNKDTGKDMASLAGNPSFANPYTGDFHLRSEAGRWDPSTNAWVVDGLTSRLIDTGDPLGAFTNEPAPNGDRINIGLYGNTMEASLSPTNADIVIASVNDGGSVSGTNVLLRWVGRGPATGHTVRVEYSPDDGASWSVLASNIAPGIMTYAWDSTLVPSTVLAAWRVVSESDSNLIARSEQVFAVRNGPVYFYVNDGQTNGDVYCAAIGMATNNGVTPFTPAASIAALLSRFELFPGDAIYVDSGIYTNSESIVISQLDAGIKLQGSTNAAVGSHLIFPESTGILVNKASSTQLADLHILGASLGVVIQESLAVSLAGMHIEGGAIGVLLDRSTGVDVQNSVVRNADDGISLVSSSAELNNLVLWSNHLSSLRLSLSTVSINDSVLGAFNGPDCYAYILDVNSTLVSDYNFYSISSDSLVTRRAILATSSPFSQYHRKWNSINTWSRDTGNDRQSIRGDAGFANAAEGDFHPRSEAGRYNPMTGTFVTDTNTSLLIDGGSPLSAFSRETGDNGGRVNIGCYGNSSEASRSPTNARLFTVRFSDGGRAEGGAVPLTWRSYGAATGHTVRVQWSTNNGALWMTFLTNVPANAEAVFLDSGNSASWGGAWRVVSEQDGAIVGSNTIPFQFRNQPLSLFVNDSSVDGDVYTTEAGSILHDGTSPATPATEVASLLAAYDLEPGDVIYVDTGDYVFAAPISITRWDAWDRFDNVNGLYLGQPGLTIKGSTNEAAGGTEWIALGVNAINLNEAFGVSLEHLGIRHFPAGAGTTVNGVDSGFASLDGLRIRDGEVGASFFRSSDAEISRSQVMNYSGYGIRLRSSTNAMLTHSVIWSNQAGVSVSEQSKLKARNNLIAALTPDAKCWIRNDGPTPNLIGVIDADYNVFFTENGAYVAELLGNQYAGNSRLFQRMSAWQNETGLDIHSFRANPRFAVPGGDFHPQSPAGRFEVGAGYVTNTSEALSPLVDAGDPQESFATEPLLNGQRVNIGLYGNTEQASRTPTNGTLQVVTFRDGGSGSDVIVLRWAVSGPAIDHNLLLEFSNDGGGSWSNIATNVLASTGYYVWDSIPYGRAAAGQWRISSMEDSSLVATNDDFFALRNGGSIPYFVNDASTAGDVYSTAPGNDANSGYLPSSPMATLQNLLDQIDLEPGDVVYVDTGVYAQNLNVVIEGLDSGSLTNPVVIQGSTNFAGGGTRFDRITKQGVALQFDRVEHVEVRDLEVRNGSEGVSLDLCKNITLQNLTARSNRVSGVRVFGSTETRIENSLMFGNGTNGILVLQGTIGDVSSSGDSELFNNVIWGSGSAVRVDPGGSAILRNNLLQASGPESRIFSMGLNVTNILSDYNAFYRQAGALMAERVRVVGGNQYMGRLIDWQRDQETATANDLHSLSHDPLVANALEGDFHLQSAGGRELPSGGITNDPSGVYSSLIDTGDPLLDSGSEPSPNGSRINIGRYGGTTAASRSRTTPWLLALTLNDGGRVSGTNTFYWAAGGWDATNRVRLELAADGVDYVVIASNFPVYTDGWSVDLSGYPPSQVARWRIVSESLSNTVSAINSPFVIRNEPFTIYVNDSQTNGDVYVTAPGSATNTGRTADSPLHDPGVALELFPFGPGDVLYIDTGSYTPTNAIGMRLGLIGDVLKTGEPGDPIRVVGSTNHQAGGTVLTVATNKPYVFRVEKGQHFSLENFTVSGATNGLDMVDVEDVVIERVVARDGRVGFYAYNVSSGRFERCTGWRNHAAGLQVTLGTVAWDQGVLAGNKSAAIRVNQGSLSVSNSILSSTNELSVIYEVTSVGGQLRSDYNLYWPGTNAVILKDTSVNDTYVTVKGMQAVSRGDKHSIKVDPLFANPATGDFHPRSSNGRFSDLLDGFLFADTQTSWAVDAAYPGLPFGAETSPNGARANLGLYGGTIEASRSPTNKGLLTVSMRDGGSASAALELVWLTHGIESNDLVTLEYTVNDGLDWVLMTNGFSATNRTYDWNFSSITSTPLARWRVTLDGDSSVSDTTSVFTIRNGPILYYVNDTNLNGDVYTFDIGSDLNNGITVSTPVQNVATILERFDLDGGDKILVDTGLYPVESNIVIRASDSGDNLDRMTIVGSTNLIAGGSLLYRVTTNAFAAPVENDEAIFELLNASHVAITDLALANANIGIYLRNSVFTENNLFQRLIVQDGGYAGLMINQSTSNTLDRILVTRMTGYGIEFDGGDLYLTRSIIWSNANGGINCNSGLLRMTNNVIHAYGPVTNAVLQLGLGSRAIADYNNLVVEGDASYGMIQGEPIVGLPQLSDRTTQHLHSVSVDPGFADPAANDFRPLSPAGRYDPILEDFVTTDTNFSWLIDTGDPSSSFDNETDPNGGRRNIGLYGDTLEASRSRTNAWLLAVTAMAGGRVNDLVTLYWFYGNLDVTNKVQLDYSVDSGTNWIQIAENVDIGQDGYVWISLNADPFQSPTTKWRVQLAADSNIVDETDTIFGLNGPFAFYVNDDSLSNDVFTTAVGDNANLGISSNAPMATAKAILDRWDMDPEDVMYIDTGHYIIGSNDFVVVGLQQAGNSFNPVTIRGSTNDTVFDSSAISETPIGPEVFEINAPYIVVEDLSFYYAGIKAVGTNVALRRMNIQNGNVDLSGPGSLLETLRMTNGSVFAAGANVVVREGVIRNGGLEMSGSPSTLENTLVSGERSPLVLISGTNILLRNNTLVADKTAIRQTGEDSLSTIQNNIIVAGSLLPDGFCFENQGGVILSDYNLFQTRNSAWFGNAQDGLWERLLYWQQKSGGDLNSVADDPQFADEGAGDFHVRSIAGRYEDGIWVTDVLQAASIDAGFVGDDFALETTPNGGRVNLGAYGNTKEASRSLTSPWLYAMSMNDGGVMRGTNTLRWRSGAVDATNRVMLQYSADAGTNWTLIAGNLPVTDGAYAWDTTTASNTLDALWRVTLEGDSNVWDDVNSIFNIRNDIRAFYVNDASTNDDVYTTAAGSSANDGRTPATPKATLEEVLASYDTEALDTIYIDTGIYSNTAARIIWSRGGNTNGSLTIQGSTNQFAGGTVFRRFNQNGDTLVVNASFVNVYNIGFENAKRGLVLVTNRSVDIREVVVRGTDIGIDIERGQSHRVRSSVIWSNQSEGVLVREGSSDITVENITFANNVFDALNIRSDVSDVTIQNNIFYHDIATSNKQYAITGATGSVLNAFIDYNVYYFGPSSIGNAYIYGTYNTLLPWQRLQYKDFRSAITNPLLHDVAAGDFHLQSAAGRYDPATTSFVVDVESSWAIDMGNPYTAYDAEPIENGGRVNIGAFGNTAYASIGRTNEIVFARTGNGLLPINEAENPYPLIWYMLNLPGGLETVTIQYSGDGGSEWINVETGVPSYQEYILWTNSPTYNSFNARWRIVGEGVAYTNYIDSNDAPIQTFFGEHEISDISYLSSNRVQFIWRGAWDENYQVQYASNFVASSSLHEWFDLGPVTNLTIGGDIPYVDLQSTQFNQRIYRVIWLGTNGIPFP